MKRKKSNNTVFLYRAKSEGKHSWEGGNEIFD